MVEELTVDTRPFVRAGPGAGDAVLGPYRLHERLGVGGLASVYRARRIDEPDGPDLALKRLHPHLMNDASAIASFVKEMYIACLLDHPLIRRVHSLCREQDELFMTMEYVDGQSLAVVLKRAAAAQRRLPLRGVLAVLHRLCSALHHAHELVDEHGDSVRFVHRDISPSNLIVSPSGKLTLIDMGVARARVGDAATQTGLIRGKFGYMAPEILAGEPYDRRADVFSIGVVAWEMLAVRKLFPVADRLDDIDRIRSRPIARPSAMNPACPTELDDILMRALATAPADRWPTCRAMGDAVQKVAVRLQQSLADTSIAELAVVVDLPLRRRRRLARGTHSDVIDTPAAPVVHRSEPEPPRSARFRIALALAILCAVAVLVVGALWRSGQPGPARVTLPTDDAGIPDAMLPVDAAPDAGVDAAPDAGGVGTVPASDVTRIGGPWPRSRTSSYPYRARLCIDAEGAVTETELLEGPERLEGRIRYCLRRWRYEPYRRRGNALPVCFVIESEVHKMPRPR